MAFTRRTLLLGSVLPFIGTARAAGQVTVSVDAGQTLGAIPADYMGLGYEISSVAVPGLLAAKNAPYVQLVRNLGKREEGLGLARALVVLGGGAREIVGV